MFTLRAIRLFACLLCERAIAIAMPWGVQEKSRITLTLAVAMGLLASRAAASPIVIEIRGIISSVDDDFDILDPQVAAGAPFTAILSSDTNVLDSNPDERIGRFENAPAMSSLLFDLNGTQLTTVGSGDSPAIQVTNDAPYGNFDWIEPPPADAFEMWTASILSGIDTFSVSASMSLVDISTLAFDSDHLPASLDPAAFDMIDFSVWGYRFEGGQSVKTFTVELAPQSFTFVPEPSAMALGGMGALALIASSIRRLTPKIAHPAHRRTLASEDVGVNAERVHC